MAAMRSSYEEWARYGAQIALLADICTSSQAGVTLWLMNEYIYLRLSHSDREMAERLSNELEKAGHKVWLSQGLADGAGQQQKQVQFAIERSDAFVLGLTPDLLTETGTDIELALAQEADKPVFVAQLRPVSLSPEWETALADRPVADFSLNFDAGLAELLSSLAGAEMMVDDDDRSGNFFGGDYVSKVPALAGERIVWSDSGLYWFKNWKTLARVLVIQTNRRLIFFWDSRDIWKWKPREADQLEEAFPMALPLEQITAVGEINKPKSFLIFATGRPYVDIMTTGNQQHRFSLEVDFEAHIDALREAVAGNG